MMLHNTYYQNLESKKHEPKYLEIVKQEMEYVNIAVLGVSKLKWPGMGHFLSGNCKEFYLGNKKLRKNGVALILMQDIAQACWNYIARSDQEYQ